jgi:hypothetical protein
VKLRKTVYIRGSAMMEPDYKSKTSLLYDLTYWAVEFLYLCDSAGFCSIKGYDYELFRSAKHE